MERVNLARINDKVRDGQMKVEGMNHLPEKEKRSGQVAVEKKKKPFL